MSDNQTTAEKPRKPGFYWVTEHGCMPTIAKYRQGMWTFSGCSTPSPDRQVVVLSSHRLVAPATPGSAENDE